MNVLVPAVNQDHDERPQDAAALEEPVADQAQTPEIDLGERAGRDGGHTHRGRLLAEPAVLDREAVQRAVGDRDPAAREQIMTLGQRQRTLIRAAQPGAERVAVRLKLLLGGARRPLARPGPEPRQNLGRQRLPRLVATWVPAERVRRVQVARDGLARATRGPSNRPTPLPAVRPA